MDVDYSGQCTLTLIRTKCEWLKTLALPSGLDVQQNVGETTDQQKRLRHFSNYHLGQCKILFNNIMIFMILHALFHVFVKIQDMMSRLQGELDNNSISELRLDPTKWPRLRTTGWKFYNLIHMSAFSV